MKSDKKILKSASVIFGALLTTSLAAAPAASMDLLAYNDLGSGAQVRSHLIDMNANQLNQSDATTFKFGELKCGEGEKGETAKATSESDESKTGEAKCGEGKCGEGKKGETAEASSKSDESKTSEAKCGEGKCG